MAQLLNPSLPLLLSPSLWMDPRSPTSSAFPLRAPLSLRVYKEAEGKQLDRCLGAGAPGGAGEGLTGHLCRGSCCIKHCPVFTEEETGLLGTTAGALSLACQMLCWVTHPGRALTTHGTTHENAHVS